MVRTVGGGRSRGSLLRASLLPCCLGSGAQDGVDRAAVQVPPVGDYRADPGRVPNVGQWICIEEYQVGDLSRLDGPERIGRMEEARGIQCGGLQRGER